MTVAKSLSQGMCQFLSIAAEPPYEGDGTAEPSDIVAEEDNNEERVEREERARQKITPAEKELTHKLHVNLGHPPNPQLIRALEVAGGKAQVIQYVRQQFQCPSCVNTSGQAIAGELPLPEPFGSTH